jgi:PKD repeat protein
METPQKKCFVPYVDFVAQHVNPSTLEVSFTPVTTFNGTINSYKWDFGDGTTFDGANPPAHKYPSSANSGSHYKVKLTVANECGESFWTQEITVSNCLPDTKFSFRYVNDSTVEFTNQTKTEGNTSYKWDFGDGSSGANTEKSFTHIYKTDHPFVVLLKAANGCGENNYSDTVSVCRKPVASQTITATSCGSVTINASASTNSAKYQWNFGDGTILPAVPSSSSLISHSYSKSGTYTIQLTVFNAGGCDSATTSNKVTVTAASSLGDNHNWSYTSNDLDFNFTRSSLTNATSYKWNFGDGDTSNTQNPSHSFADPGNYTITLSASNGCGATSEFSVPVNVPYYKALSNIPATGFQQVLAFSSSLIYFLGNNGKLYRADTSGKWSTIDLPPGLNFNNETKLYKDQGNNLWIYGKKEVALLRSNGSSWTSYFGSTGFKNNVTINSIAVDYNNNLLWTIGNGELHSWNKRMDYKVRFSSMAFSEKTGKLWLSSTQSNDLFYINQRSTQINKVNTSEILNGGDNLRISPTGEIYLATGTGILRLNSSGNTIKNYNSAATSGMINGRPLEFDFDEQGNLWVLLSGQLYKVPIANSNNTKKYSFNTDLSSLTSISALNFSNTDSDILLAKKSGNAAIKIR